MWGERERILPSLRVIRAIRGRLSPSKYEDHHEFPPRLTGYWQVSVLNLFNQNFVLLVDPLALEPSILRRQISGSIRFNL